MILALCSLQVLLSFAPQKPYCEVEHIAQTCNCFVSLQEETGTIAFYRRENC